MGFGRELRRAKDVTLDLGMRQRALGCAIQFAQPIGFHATWAYLEAKAGHHWRHPDFLPIAVAHLAKERSARRQAVAEYTRIRVAQKAMGMRAPQRATVTGDWPARWHGDERSGAAHSLAWWQRGRAWDRQELERHQIARPILQISDKATTGAALGPMELAELEALLAWSVRQVFVIGWETDRDEYRVAWIVYRVLGQMHVLEHGAPTLATRLTFVGG